MKYLFGIIMLCIVAYLFRPVESIPIISIPSPTPTTPYELPQVTLGDEIFSYAVIKTKPQHVQLVPNFAKRETAQTIIENNACQGAINGGFYDIDNKPLGLFRTNNETLREASVNTLLNGFFAIDQNNRISIGSEIPDETSKIALQTGPILMPDVILQIRDDEHARRMIVATSGDENIFFITVYTSESVFGGPLLGDLPAIVEKIATAEGLNFSSAINLDGGSASFFHSSSLTLSELTPVGSIFCITEK